MPCSDVTYIDSGEGWFYLATVIDLFNPRGMLTKMGQRSYGEPVGIAEGARLSSAKGCGKLGQPQ